MEPASTALHPRHTPWIRLNFAILRRCVWKLISVKLQHIPNRIRDRHRYVLQIEHLIWPSVINDNSTRQKCRGRSAIKLSWERLHIVREQVRDDFAFVTGHIGNIVYNFTLLAVNRDRMSQPLPRLAKAYYRSNDGKNPQQPKQYK